MKKIESYIKEQLFKIRIESVDSKKSLHFGVLVPAFVIFKKILIGNYSPFSFASTTFAVTEYEIWESEHMIKAIDYQQTEYIGKCPNKRTELYVYVSLKLKNGLNQLKSRINDIRN